MGAAPGSFADFAANEVGGAVGGALGGALSGLGTPGGLGWNVLAGAAEGAAWAAVGWGAKQITPLTKVDTGEESSGEARVEVNAVRADGAGGTSGTDDTSASPKGGPTAQQLKDSPAVQGAIQKAYDSTNAGNPKLAHEEGGWVYENVKTHQLITLPADPGPAGTGPKG